jgi:hypothetical protein
MLFLDHLIIYIHYIPNLLMISSSLPISYTLSFYPNSILLSCEACSSVNLINLLRVACHHLQDASSWFYPMYRLAQNLLVPKHNVVVSWECTHGPLFIGSWNACQDDTYVITLYLHLHGWLSCLLSSSHELQVLSYRFIPPLYKVWLEWMRMSKLGIQVTKIFLS